MTLVKKIIPDDAKCNTHKKFNNGQPSVVTIHWVGPYPGQTPEIVRDWWIKSGGEASAHFIIKDDICLQCWEIDTIAWHTGCSTGNNVSIGIEIIPQDTDGQFSKLSIKTLKALLDTLPRMPVVRHYDWTGKDCPKFYCNNNEWKSLLNKIGRL